MLTLYADLKGIYGQNRYKIAYREILEAVNRGEGEKNQQGYSGKINGKEEEPVSLRQRDSVYRRLLELLALSDLHRKKLMERGLTKEQIEVYQFCSTPPNSAYPNTLFFVKHCFGYVFIVEEV